MPRGKRLHRFRTGEYRYLGRDLTLLNRKGDNQKGIQWASCAIKETGLYSSKDPRLVAKEIAGSVYAPGLFETATIIFATFVFGGLAAAPTTVIGYQGFAPNIQAIVSSTTGLGQAGLFGTGFLSALGIDTPEPPDYVKFERPCSENAGVEF